MKVYAQFLVDGMEPCASDSVFILDGRNSLENMICDTINKGYSLRKVKPKYNGYRIIRADRFIDTSIDKSKVLSECSSIDWRECKM